MPCFRGEKNGASSALYLSVILPTISLAQDLDQIRPLLEGLFELYGTVAIILACLVINGAVVFCHFCEVGYRLFLFFDF